MYSQIFFVIGWSVERLETLSRFIAVYVLLERFASFVLVTMVNEIKVIGNLPMETPVLVPAD